MAQDTTTPTPQAEAALTPTGTPETQAAYAQGVIGPDGGVYVWVPAGEFMMGSEDEGDPEEEKPQHRVRITNGFWLGKYEVTNEQYRAFCNATGRKFPRNSTNGLKHPVVGVYWEDAKAYCDHYGLRLPTEAEWEYAARGPEGRRWPWGNEFDRKKCCNASNLGPAYDVDHPVRTMPVGNRPAGDSWCGASDMAGNVHEWCNDWLDDRYYRREQPRDDPQGGPPTDQGHVWRGGSWDDDGEHCRSAWRIVVYGRETEYGFRCAATARTP